MTIEIGGSLSNYTLAAGQTLSASYGLGSQYLPAITLEVSSNDTLRATIAGEINLTTDGSDQMSDLTVEAFDGGFFGDYGASLLTVTSSGVVHIDTTNASNSAQAFGPGVSLPILNEGLIDVSAANSATGFMVNGSQTDVAVPALDNAGTVHVVSTFSEATGAFFSGVFVNSGVIDVSGAFQPTGVSQRDGSFDNTGSIVVHDLKAGIAGTAVIFESSSSDPHFLNAGLLQGDVALQVIDNEFTSVKLAVNNVYENTGQMVGAINMGFGNETLLNEGQITGAVDLGTGNDVYDGRLGTETGLISAGAGNDTLMGGAGFDNLQGNQGDDSETGGAGADIVVGGQGDDLQHGDAGNDVVWGNLGNDTLDGGDGNDQVRGGQGDDSVSGGAGDDYVSGDRGNDTESGGAGADLFHGSQDAGIDKVLDFNQAEGDRVELDPGTTYTVSQVGADTVIDMGPIGGTPNQMILVGVQLSTLKDGWIFEG